MAYKKIMIVDDDKDFLAELDETIRLSGYATVAVYDSMEALHVARAAKPDLVLLDLKMPKKTGFQLAEELRGNPETADIPIIAMSAVFFRESDSALMRLFNIQRCMKKPFNPLDVIAQIEVALR